MCVNRTQIVAGQPQLSTQLPANVATTTDLENLKKELTSIVRSEVAAAKRDILDGISNAAFFHLYTFISICLHNVQKMCKVSIDYS